MAVMIGIDPHKRSHTAVAINGTDEVLGQLRVTADRRQLDRLLGFAATWPERVWAVENANGLGRLLSRQLLAAGETVIDVPAKLSARVRALSGAGHKTDSHDARSTAVAGRHGTGVKQMSPTTRQNSGVKRDRRLRERRTQVDDRREDTRDPVRPRSPRSAGPRWRRHASLPRRPQHRGQRAWRRGTLVGACFCADRRSMAMTTARPIDEQDRPYESLTRPQMRALLDRRARRQFRMSIDEFEAALDRGEFADEPQATALAILLRGA